MNAKPLPVDVSESTEDKVNNTKSNSENTGRSVAASTDSYEGHARDEQPLKDLADLPFSTNIDGSVSQRIKKSSFQITRIVKAGDAGDSADDLDDVTSTDDVGSSVMEASKTANTESDARSLDAFHSSSSVEEMESLSSCQKHLCPRPIHSSRPRPSDINSRFKIVKIESNKPLNRGRWTCLEFVDPPQLNVSLEKAKHDGAESAASCIASPIYYVHVEKEDPSNNPFAAAIIYSNGQPSLEPNPLPLRDGAMCPSTCSNLVESCIPADLHHLHDSGIEMVRQKSSLSSELCDHDRDLMRNRNGRQIPASFVPTTQHPSTFGHNPDHGALMNGILVGNDNMNITNDDERGLIRTGSESVLGRSVFEAATPPFFAIVANSADGGPAGFVDSEISGGICALDNKIEQAMDLVKSHLMFAVHEEVEQLKEQIKELTIKKGQLEYENNVLRASATQETLEKLQGPSPTMDMS